MCDSMPRLCVSIPSPSFFRLECHLAAVLKLKPGGIFIFSSGWASTLLGKRNPKTKIDFQCNSRDATHKAAARLYFLSADSSMALLYLEVNINANQSQRGYVRALWLFMVIFLKSWKKLWNQERTKRPLSSWEDKAQPSLICRLIREL